MRLLDPDRISLDSSLESRPLFNRRDFIVGTMGALLDPSLWSSMVSGNESRLSSSDRLSFERSRYVYISPLRSNGGESRCHGEVWFAWIDDNIIVTSRTETWKVRSVRRGLDQARIWVGDYGRWKKGKNESFRGGSRFDTRSALIEDPILLSQTLALFANKYPKEFPKWKDRMETGHRDGTRVLLRYELA